MHTVWVAILSCCYYYLICLRAKSAEACFILTTKMLGSTEEAVSFFAPDAALNWR